jgi:hypothetical protein
MCDVPSTAVFCSESIECFPGIVSKFFLKFFVTIIIIIIIITFLWYLTMPKRKSDYCVDNWMTVNNNCEHCNVHNTDEIRQGRQRTYNVTPMPVGAIIVAVEKQ